MTSKLLLSDADAEFAANAFIEYYANTPAIEDYLRRVKLERMAQYPPSLPGLGPDQDFFSDFSLHPSRMNFRIDTVDTPTFMRYLDLTSSHVNEACIPGKNLLWVVRETTTNTVVGMIRFGSPLINSKPRNLFLGQPLDTMNAEVMARFNNSVIMGFVIVPTQPFGYNYLGGKLLASICCSHEAREAVNAKYGTNICAFETTSLYGSTKTASQYDGMKPYLRFIGLTDSNFTPILTDDHFLDLYRFFCDRNGGHLISDDATSKKLKRQSSMISIIKNSLRVNNPRKYEEFTACIESATSMTEQKRTYLSTYGYDNLADYLNLKTDTLIKRDNFDAYSLDNVIHWWKKKSSKRFDSLLSSNRLRTTQEVWTDPSNIDIIR